MQIKETTCCQIMTDGEKVLLLTIASRSIVLDSMLSFTTRYPPSLSSIPHSVPSPPLLPRTRPPTTHIPTINPVAWPHRHTTNSLLSFRIRPSFNSHIRRARIRSYRSIAWVFRDSCARGFSWSGGCAETFFCGREKVSDGDEGRVNVGWVWVGM